MSIRLGYQIPNFSYPGGVGALFPAVVAQAEEAERSGFDAVFVMDHFYQLPNIGAPTEPMLEAYTALAALSGVTSRVQLSTLVTGNTYRNPTLLAKIVSTLDIVSGGRAVLALGAGWYELEHRALGFEFGTISERFERLDEALQILVPMLRGERPTLDGRWYRTEEALASPLLRTDIPVMLGGGGEKKTFGLAARWADHLNIICAPDELPRKLDALAARLGEVDRDPATLEVSTLVSVLIDEDGDAARALCDRYLESTAASQLPPAAQEAFRSRMFVGTPDDVAADLQTRVVDRGVHRLIINMPANGHLPGVVALAATTLAPLVS